MAGLKPLLLNNGVLMPRLGVGTFLLKGDECKELVHRAVTIGYRMVDTAYSYQNETAVGEAIALCEKEGIVKREKMFVCTKVPQVYLAPENVKLCVEESKENLKTKYIDMLFIHSPWGMKNHGDGNLRPLDKDGYYEAELYDLNQTWAAFEKEVREGNVKSIGVSNFTEKNMRQIMEECDIKPQAVQFECHAYYQQRELGKFCLKHGITCMAYSPLGSPGAPAYQQTDESASNKLLDDPVVKEIADRYQKSPAQILLQFLGQRNIAVIPKTSSVSRLEENFAIGDFRIVKEDMDLLKTLDRGLRYFNFKMHSKNPLFPKAGEFF